MILITGYNGFIGSALLNAIGDSEYEEAITKANSFIKQLIN